MAGNNEEARENPQIDLHLHSCFSDGDLTPKELAEKCKEAGLETVALTDHEHLGGLPEFHAEGAKLGLITISGVEISTDHNGSEQHILGLGFHAGDKQLISFLRRIEQAKQNQIQIVVNKLRELGLTASFPEIRSRTLGTPTIRHVVHTVFEKPENKTVLENLGVSDTRSFREFFAPPDGLAYVKRTLPTIQEAIATIKKAGGITVWAHAFWKDQTSEFILENARTLKTIGLDGLEVFYPFHDEDRVRALHEITRKLQLLETAGSDFHSFAYESLGRIFVWKDYGIKGNFPDFTASKSG